MSTYNLSRITDSNGDNWDIVAKNLESQKTFALTGDVTGSQTSDLSSGLSISTTVANSAITSSKLASSAVTTDKIAGSAVTLAKLNSDVIATSVTSGSSKLPTGDAVYQAISSAIAGQGSYLGKQTVATINTWTSANLQNGDRVICSDSGTVTLGNISVRAGEDLIFWKSGTTAEWQSMDGEFKLKQTAKLDPTASGTTVTAIATITQDANGEITATKSTIRSATTSQTGIVQLSSSSSTSEESKAATPKGVWTAINTLDVTDTAVSNKFVTAVSETDGKISVSRAQPTIANISNLQSTLDGKEPTFTITYNASTNALVFSKAFVTA